MFKLKHIKMEIYSENISKDFIVGFFAGVITTTIYFIGKCKRI